MQMHAEPPGEEGSLSHHPPSPQLKYSQLIHGLAAENIIINRKALASLAQNEPLSFKALVDTAKRQSEALSVAQYLRAKHGQTSST